MSNVSDMSYACSSTVSAKQEIKRKYPIIGAQDTFVFNSGKLSSVHSDGTANFIADEDIKKIYKATEKVNLSQNIPSERGERRRRMMPHASRNGNSQVFAEKTDYGWVIQQQGQRGCTAATTAMLIMDNGKAPSLQALGHRNLGNSETMARDLNRAGLNPMMSNVDKFEELSALIKKSGPAIIGVHGKEIGGHVVILDRLTKTSAIIRDPYHGWCIRMSKDALKEICSLQDIIQVKR